MDDDALAIIAKLIIMFPNFRTYHVTWSYYFDVGEGTFTSYYNESVSYPGLNDKIILDMVRKRN